MEERCQRRKGSLNGQEGNVGEPHRHGEVPAEFPMENDGRWRMMGGISRPPELAPD